MANFVFEGPSWASLTVTYSFATGNFPADAATPFSHSVATAEKAIFREAFARWSAVSNLKFVEVADPVSSAFLPDIRVGYGFFGTSASTIGQANYTFTGSSFKAGVIVRVEDPGELALVTDSTGTLVYANTSSSFLADITHEIGHALGLGHSTDRFSIMFPTAGSANRVLDASDIAGITALYGTPATVPPPVVSNAWDGLIDASYYTTTYPDVARAGANPVQHFNAGGWTEYRNPDAVFSTRAYEAAYADVRQAGVNPLAHYDQSGWKEGRDPSAGFDTRLYLTFNPDVARAGIDPLLHWLNNGQAEHRKSAPAVGPAITAGFDPLYYRLANPDVGLANLDSTAHWRASGWREGRNPDAFFDTAYYLSHNADVKAAGIDPLAHYMGFGWKEHRDPSSHFLTDAYLSHYADVARAGINPLQHFLTSGLAEGRSGFGDLI